MFIETLTKGVHIIPKELEIHPVTAIFRKWPDGSIDALFPYEAELMLRVQCYSSIGQHGIADYDWVIEQTVPAKPEEYASLLKELESIGYEVTIRQRVNRNKMVAAWDSLYD